MSYNLKYCSFYPNNFDASALAGGYNCWAPYTPAQLRS